MPVRILDPAAGGGRYVLETASRIAGPVGVTLRDSSPSNLEAAAELGNVGALDDEAHRAAPSPGRGTVMVAL